MPIKVEMPRLSDTMQQGTVVKWNVKEGQKIKSGDVVADIETDKATMELQSFEDGTVASIVVPAGQTVAVGTVILLLAGAGEDIAAAKSAAGSAVAPATKAAGAQNTPASTLASSTTTMSATAQAANGAHTPAEGEPNRIFASPLAKKIAAESGVDLGGLQGSGPSGRIVRKDVEEALRGGGTSAPSRATGFQRVAPASTASRTPTRAPSVPPLAATLTGRVVPLNNMRRTIAKRLVESKTTIPHYQVTVEVAMDAILDLRKQLNDQLAAQGVKLSVNDFLVRACALAMHQHPYVNSRWVPTPNNESIELLADVNIGIAIALDESKGGGLVVATLRSADQIGLRQISAQSKQLSEKARTKGLTLDEMDGSTFTISNLGMFGVDHFTAIINPPNVAILAVGAAVEKPVVKNGELTVGHVMSMTMSSDHRVVDGAMAAQYLATVKGLLEAPATLLV